MSFPSVTASDFLQTYRLNNVEVQRQEKDQTPKEDDEVLASLKDHIEKRVQEAEISTSITTVLRLLMLQGMNDAEVIAWGRYYFTKNISPSIPIWQVMLCSIETRRTLPNDETALRGIRLCKEICASLIKDFGFEEGSA